MDFACVQVYTICEEDVMCIHMQLSVCNVLRKVRCGFACVQVYTICEEDVMCIHMRLNVCNVLRKVRCGICMRSSVYNTLRKV